MKFFLALLFTFLLPHVSFASLGLPDSIPYKKYQVSKTEVFLYKKGRFKDIFRSFPANTANTAKDLVSKQYYPYALGSIAATAALIPADPFITRNASEFGQRLGFSYNHSFKKIGPLKIIPADIGTLLYFLGNGTSVILMSGGLATYGAITKNYRAQSVSAQLIQSILLTGLYAQTLKRITGRESPFVTSSAGRENSKWRPFPGFIEYQKNTSRYDAMPSGHLTTGLAAWTILAKNYPEIKWIKPVGYSILGLMCFEMVQSGVHWTSDYPIAILFGYFIGKNISESAIKKEVLTPTEVTKKKFNITPFTSSVYGVQTFGVQVIF